MSLADYTLGAEASAWIRAALAEGLSLARALLRRADLEAGRIVTLLPPGLSAAAVSDLRHGGKVPAGRGAQPYLQDTLDGVSDRIAGCLRGRGLMLAVAEDVMMRSTDKAIEMAGAPPIAASGGEVYRFMVGQGENPRVVRDVIRSADRVFPPVVCAVGPLPDDEMHRWQGERAEVDARDLARVAERAEVVVVGAYDGEGYLIWQAPLAAA